MTLYHRYIEWVCADCDATTEVRVRFRLWRFTLWRSRRAHVCFTEEAYG